MNVDTAPLAFAGLHFVRPLWLLGLLALPLLAWAWRTRRRRQSVWRDAVDAHLLPHLLEHGGGGRQPGVWLGLLALALALLALSGPSWRKFEQPLWQTSAPLVIALDLSSATLAGDLPPSRLAQARAKIGALLQARQGGQVALVAYANDAFTVAPLTDDVANIGLFLDALDPDVMPQDGNRTERAIAWSVKLLRQAGFSSGDILLVTGQADAEARNAASRAASDGYRVSVLGLGTANGAAYRKPDGSIEQARLDAPGLRALASSGGGAFEPLAAGLGDLQALDVLDPAQANGRAATGGKRATWRDEGFWLLPPLLLLVALGFRRGAAFGVLALCLLLPLPPVHAAGQTATAPAPADGSLWRRPDQQAHARMQRGEQAYRDGDFEAASQAYSGVRSADGAYNLGNALAKQGRYEEAIQAYEQALAKQPGMSDATANRKAVEQAMKRKPPKGPNDKLNPRDNQQGQSQSKPGQQGQDGSRQGEQGQQGEPPPRQGEQNQDDVQSPGQQSPQREQQKPADQRAADAAQKQRMQRELDKQRAQRQADDGKQVEGRPDRAEQAAQRERSAANDAWLRRVPDDPGALLRAKFQLEYERRRERGED